MGSHFYASDILDGIQIILGAMVVMGFLIGKTVKAIRSEDWKDTGVKTPKKKTPRSRSGADRPAASGSVFQSEAADHEHITLSGLSKEARLEQLDTLLEAGLLDKDEYRERKRQIEEGDR